MHILMIAPEPFLEPRGTPFSVYHRARALSRLGHTIDLVVYPLGKQVSIPQVAIYRTWSLPFIRRVKIGPSLAKFPLDALLFLRAAGLLFRRRYDCIHTHQEAGIFGALLGRLFRIPHVYDLHADLAEELVNFRFTRSRTLIKLMRGAERIMFRSAKVVIVVYPELQDLVMTLAPTKPMVLITNTAVAAQEVEQSSNQDQMASGIERLLRELALPANHGPLLVYTGTFEAYQGLDLLVASMPEVLAAFPQSIYLLVGGQPDQVAALAAQAQRLGVSHALRLPGQRPPEEMPLFMQLADILLSPRCTGTNTPLKIYSYLHAGKPLLVTNIRSHTQILTEDAAVLVDPKAESLAQGTLSLLADSALRSRLARNARALAMRSYSYDTFLSQTARTYELLAAKVSPA